jgi:hypothetical protein
MRDNTRNMAWLKLPSALAEKRIIHEYDGKECPNSIRAHERPANTLVSLGNCDSIDLQSVQCPPTQSLEVASFNNLASMFEEGNAAPLAQLAVPFWS